MRAGLRIGIIATAAITAAVAIPVTLTLPPSPLALHIAVPDTHVAGAYHVHTTRSDGTGTVEEIAAAASDAGLRFVILTDHGDGTRPPDPPTYIAGALVIDAVEINTREGHLVALGLEAASPYRLAGASVDVIGDIHRMGGLAILAHPDSPRSELAWRGGAADADGIEWINVDSEWRDESTLTLIGRGAHALLRPSEAIASLFSRPAQTLDRWDRQARLQPTFGLAALDAHASIGWREQEEPRRSVALAQPGYDVMFRTLAQTVVLDRPMTGDAGTDADAVIAAIAAGRSFSTVRAFAWPSVLEFGARQGDVAYDMGARLEAAAGPITLEGRLPPGVVARLELRHDGEVLAVGQGSVTTAEPAAPGVYRLEAYLPGRPVPWIVSNPITVGGVVGDAGTGRAGRGRGRGRGSINPPGTIEPRAVALDDGGWRVEHEASSSGTVVVDGDRLRFDYALGAGTARGQYAAFVRSDPGSDGVQTMAFTAAAAAPMRVSVQVRLPVGRGRVGQRWRTSIYVDEVPRQFSLHLQDFESADRPTARQPIVTPIESLLFVVDTLNSAPGATGTIWLSDLTLGVNRME